MTSKTQFGPTYTGHYPSEMRTQLWPLCCGARILSGFKATQGQSVDDLVKQIESTQAMIPDHQVFSGERMLPKLTFLTLNEAQTKNETIMQAIEKAGFKKFADGRPRGSLQSFFVKDDTAGTFKVYSSSESNKAAA